MLKILVICAVAIVLCALAVQLVLAQEIDKALLLIPALLAIAVTVEAEA